MTSETEQLRAHLTTLQDELQHKFKSARDADDMIERLEKENTRLRLTDDEQETLREILGDLVACVRDDLQRLPEGYRGRKALERALRILKEQADE